VGSDQWAVVARFVTRISCIFVLAVECGAQTVITPSQIPCSEEHVQPNFELKIRQHVSGELLDPTGAVFQDSVVILRKQDDKGRFADYRRVTTDETGHFDLKFVDPGKYRFLPARNRGWRQPKEVVCETSRECEIRLTLELNPTDEPFAGCPIR
jgi:hypothetical protein